MGVHANTHSTLLHDFDHVECLHDVGHSLLEACWLAALSHALAPPLHLFRYVVDSGRVKRRVYNLRTGVSRFEVGWTSQAGADQRAGRAGRTGPGHCYRLYSPAVFGEQFAPFDEPASRTLPVASVLLQLLDMGIRQPALFPFPSAPPAVSMESALQQLAALGAIELPPPSASEEAGESLEDKVSRLKLTITPVGRTLAQLPVAPHLGKMLLVGRMPQLQPYTLALTAALSVRNLMQSPRPPPALRAALAAAKRRSAAEPAAASTAAGNGSDASYEDLENAQLWSSEDEAAGQDAAAEREAEAARLAKMRAEFQTQRNAAQAAHARWRCDASDAITALRAVGAFTHAALRTHTVRWTVPGGSHSAVGPAYQMDWAAGAAFSKTAWLRHKAMREIYDARKQLWLCMVRAQLIDAPRAPGQPQEQHAQLADTAGIPEASGDAAELLSDGSDDDEHSAGAELDQLPARKWTLAAAFPAAMSPPTAGQEALLQQVVVSGLLHQVARRAPPDEIPQLLLRAGYTGSVRRLRASLVPYIPADPALPSPVFIHPSCALSNCAVHDLPGWLVFSEITTSTRHYLQGVTACEPAWLPKLGRSSPLLTMGAPLESPGPVYDAAQDCISVAVQPAWGQRHWALPITRVPHPAGEDCVRWFARSVLEGVVVPSRGWGQLVPHWACPPAMITRRAPQPRALNLVQALVAGPPGAASLAGAVDRAAVSVDGRAVVLPAQPVAPVDSLGKLLAAWQAHPKWLRREIAAWLPSQQRAILKQVWPQLVAEVLGKVKQ